MFGLAGNFLLGGARKAIALLVGLVTRYPWQCALVASLCLAWWQYRGKESAIGKLEACKDARKAEREEWSRKVAAAKAAKAKAEKDGRDAAQSAQESYDALRADNDGLRAYIARHRVPARPGSATGAGEDHNPAVPDDAAAVPTVEVPEAVLVTCDADYDYARAAYEFAQGLIERDLAIPSPQFGK